MYKFLSNSLVLFELDLVDIQKQDILINLKGKFMLLQLTKINKYIFCWKNTTLNRI